MILRAAIEPDDGDGVRREIEVVAASFEQGVVELAALTPAGWRRRNIIITAADASS